ncbi:MAG: hypothetical protein RBU37_22980, partial [Myxococcota bacterium]|nr:hypothetical protein [Myxococcota bacterium]
MKFQNPLLLGFAMLLLSACATADPPSTVPFCGDGTRQAELGEACDDGNRNNGDGCSADCRVESAKQEWFCDNAQDDDGDGMIDCADPDCGNDLNCQGAKESNCSDGLDDDNDGNADCLDEDCDGRSCGLYGQACNAQQCQCPSGFSTESQCGDNQDNDCDGKVDCFDEDCLGQPACDDVESNCSNGEDDDDDGFIDCADSDCEAQSCGEHGRLCEGGVCACPGASFETNCDDDSDDDCDGDIDCDDSDCVGSPDCIGVESVCDDGLDNDGDSMSDCMDPDCASKSCGPHGLICSSSACVCPGGATESACGDGIDND